MSQITYLKGDITQPQSDGNIIIAHICNNKGVWDSDFCSAISKRWELPEHEYNQWYKMGYCIENSDKIKFELGFTQTIQVKSNPDVYICSMIAQESFVILEALKDCIDYVSYIAYKKDATVHIPRIGYEKDRYIWEQIEPLIQKTLIKSNVPTFVYDL